MAVAEFTVVVDTNVFPHGDFSRSQFKQLVARVEKKGHRLVVPAVVTWEWAEHAKTAHDTFRSHARAAGRRLDAVLKEPISVVDEVTVDSLLQAIEESVTDAGAEIVSPNDEAANSAIRQQVLQTGHGTKTDKVKTGAADALVAAVARQISDEGERVIVLTADRRLGELVEDPPDIFVAERTKELWTLLLEVAPAEEVVVQRFEQFVLDHLQDAILNEWEALPVDSPEYTRDAAEALDIRPGATLFDVNYRGVTAVRADDVDVFSNGTEQFLSAELRIDGLVGVHTYRVTAPDGDLVQDYDEAEVEIRVLSTAELDEAFNPEAVEFEGPVRLDVTADYTEAMFGGGAL